MKLAVTGFILLVQVLWRPALCNYNDDKERKFCPPNGMRIAALNLPPYVTRSDYSKEPEGILGDFFFDVVERCFIRQCPNLPMDFFNFTILNTSTAFIAWIADNKTDFAFPLSKPLKIKFQEETYNGTILDFEPILSTPSYSLIKDVEIYNRKAKQLVFQTLFENTWPIIVFTILIAGISGVCVWILETYHNAEEFPRSFTQGSYEGFWWAFVSMTTVGYGDKTPKFILGRLFGVLWILTGLVVIAMFTATATGALSIISAGIPGMEAMKVGVLQNSSAELVAQQQGAKVTLLAPFDSLYDALKKEEIDGIFMDAYQAAYYLDHKNDSVLKVFLSVASDISYYFAAPMHFVQALKEEHESCFRKQLDNKNMDDLVMKYLKPVQAYHPESDSESLVSGKSESTRTFLLITMGVFVGLILLGTVSELVYRKVWRPKKKVQSSEDGINLKDIRMRPDTVKTTLKDVEDKLAQLLSEVGKLQEQVSAISSQANGSFGSEHVTSHI